MTGADLLKLVAPRLAKVPDGIGISFEDALNRAVGVVFNRLLLRRSAIIEKQFDDVTIEDETTTLPSDFYALAGGRRLYLLDSSDEKHRIIELPADVEEPEDGDPAYFQLVGVRDVRIIPAPEETYTLSGWYFSEPKDLSLSSTLPWSGLFDDALADAVVLIVAGGDLAQIDAAVDAVVSGRSVSPRRNRCHW